MAAEEDGDGGRSRGARPAVAAVDAARTRAVRRAAPAAARGWRPPARRLPPDLIRERPLLPAVGDRVRRRPRQALLLLPALRLPLVRTCIYTYAIQMRAK